MGEVNVHEKHDMLSLFFHNRRLVIFSTVLCLSAALVYLIIKPVVYKVQSRIKLIDSTQSPEQVVREIESKALIQKVINTLPFHVTCYQKSLFLKKELYGNTLPVKFEFEKNNSVKFTEEVVLNFIDKNSFEIVQNDTLTHVFFNKPVKFSFAGFKATPGPFFNTSTSPLVVRFNTNEDLLEYYAHNLHVKNNPDKTLGLSLIVTNPRKGADFLNELIKIINSPVVIPAMQINSAAAIRNVKLQKLNNELVILNGQTDKLKSMQATVASGDTIIAVREALPAKDNTQLTIFTAIKPYAESPLAQFVLIPYEYEVNDDVLKNAIITFNNLQLEKQHALQNLGTPTADVTALNNKLIPLRQKILGRINVIANEVEPGSRIPAFKGVSASNTALKDSLSKIKKLIGLKQQQYYTLFQSHSIKIKPAGIRSRFIVTERPDDSAVPYSRVLTVLLLALAIGVSFPVIILSVNYFYSLMVAWKKNSKRINIETKML